MDLTKLTPAPWVSDGGAIPYAKSQRSSFADRGATIFGPKDVEVVIGGLQDEQGGAVGVLSNDDAAFIALARNAFDVMMRRRWSVRYVVVEEHHSYHSWEVVGWQAKAIPVKCRTSRSCPFTALVEADIWYKEHVEKSPNP